MAEKRFPVGELTADQLPDVASLCRTALDLPEDAAEAGPIVERLSGTAGPPGFVARSSTGKAVGVVLTSTGYCDPTVGHVDLVAVDPAYRRRGIGRDLLRRAETALAEAGAGEVVLAGNPPRYAWPGIDVRYTSAVCTALALDYTQDRTAWNMTVDLSDPSPAVRPTDDAEAQLSARGVTVRRATRADVPVLSAFVGGTFGAGWADEVADSIDRPAAGCYLAVRHTAPDGSTGRPGSPETPGSSTAPRAPEVLGFAAYGSSRPSWFGPMGTAPEAQGLGIGGVLLRRCLREQQAAGHQRAQIGWAGPVPFYAGLADARIERVFLLYRKRLAGTG